jgi:ClpP class serine protease
MTATATNLTHLLSDALTTEWMMTREACVALKRIYVDALGVKSQVGSLTATDIERLWVQHEEEGLGASMHMHRDDESSMAAQTEQMKDTSYTSLCKGVAIIDVIGPIVPRVRGMSSGSVGAQQIRNDFITAFESENVKAILFNVDSPGGDARGISELAQTIARARAKNTKPIHAYAAGWMASAAYFISAASHRIIANDWASLGSIGVVIAIPPRMPEDDIEFVNTESPYKRPDVTLEEGKRVYQDKADYMGGLFIDAVAELRGVPRERVVSDFGRGSTLIGKQAVRAGLADALGTFDGALHALVTSKPLGGAGGASASDNGETNMSDKKTIWQKLFGGMSTEERREALEALEAPDGNGEGAVAGGGNGAHTTHTAQPSVDANTRAKAAAYDKLVSEQSAAAAETFARETVASKKALPAALDGLKATYLSAADDDARSPLASGSRVENLKTFVAGLPTHNLTQEVATAALPAGAAVLVNDADPEKASVEAADKGARAWAEKANTNKNNSKK